MPRSFTISAALPLANRAGPRVRELSCGIEAPLDYSVFAAAATAALLPGAWVTASTKIPSPADKSK